MSGIEKLEDIVSEHAVSIALMARAVSSIESLLTQQTVSIKEIEKAMKSQELLMEKFTHLDTRISDSVNRIHNRLDTADTALAVHRTATEAAIKHIEDMQQLKCDLITPMAINGDKVHKGMVFVGKSVGVLILAMLFFLLIWAIKLSDYTPTN